MFPQGARVRSGLRHGPLGRRLRFGALLQPHLARLRQGRGRSLHQGCLRASRDRSRAERRDGRCGASSGRGADPALPGTERRRPEQFDRWDDDYAAAMRRVHHAFPDDHDIMALLVEALITRTPRRLWDVKTGLARAQRRYAGSPRTLRALDGDDRQGRRSARISRSFICTFIAMEMSNHPEQALRSARASVDDGARRRAPQSHARAHLRAMRRLRESQDREREGDPRRRHVCGYAGFVQFLRHGARRTICI